MVTSPVLVVVTMTVAYCYVTAVSQNNSIVLSPRSRSGTMYKIFTSLQLNFYEASNYCRSEKMDLASINGAEDQQILEDVMNMTGLPEINVWTSGNDLGQKGMYFWFSTGYPFDYTNWMEGEPNHQRYGRIGQEEHCVRVEKIQNFKWNDYWCSEKSNVACQIKSH